MVQDIAPVPPALDRRDGSTENVAFLARHPQHHSLPPIPQVRYGLLRVAELPFQPVAQGGLPLPQPSRQFFALGACYTCYSATLHASIPGRSWVWLQIMTRPLPDKTLPDQGAGARAYALAQELFPICRSITGPGVRQTLGIIAREIPSLAIREVPSGTECFDWTVPREWSVREAYIETESGRRFVDFRESNLHLVGYSVPVDRTMTLEELRPHLHSLPEQPDAIPYVTSYYAERWGFCLSHRQLSALKPGNYRVRIDSTLAPGSLTYGEIILPGQLDSEVFLSTYVCHPSLGNNELSGPTVATELVKWLRDMPHRRFTYRVVFIPETIGSIVYLSRHLSELKERVIAGFNLTCVGDDRCYSYLPSRNGNTLADRAALHALKYHAPDFVRYSFLNRGSDERQYCSPGVDLPVASIMRSKYGAYPEYHTSLDDMTLISQTGLGGAITALAKAILTIEANRTYRATVLCEPHLGKRGLYPTLSARNSATTARRLLDTFTYCDGEHDLLSIAELLDAPAWELIPAVRQLADAGLIAD
jgi:aminopeptidase-like protein